jgi:hypothetical protein
MATARGEGEAAVPDATTGGTTQRSGNVVREAALVPIITTVVGLGLLFSIWLVPFSIFTFFFYNMDIILFYVFCFAAVATVWIRLDLFRKIRFFGE